MRPWNHPATRPSASSRATLPHSAPESTASKRAPESRSRPEKRGLHSIPRGWTAAGVQMQVMRRQRGPQRTAGIASRGLDPDALERPFAKQFSVRHAIERDAAGKAQVGAARAARRGAREPRHDVLGHRLHRRGEVHVALRERLPARPGRRPEERVEALVRHAQPRAVVEVLQVELEAAVVAHVDQPVADDVGMERLAIRRETHHLVFTGVHLEPEVIRERGIQQPERMGKVDLVQDAQRAALPVGERRRGPFAHAVDRQHRGLLERRREESARGVAQVVLGEQDLLERHADAAKPVEVAAHLRLEE
jgi:hypothetical protein